MNQSGYSKAELAGRIDHTLLKAEATKQEIDRVIDEAIAHRFASVCVNGVWARHVAQRLGGSGIKTCCVAGFPLGAMKATLKAIEATAAVKDGAQEIDVVAHLPYLLNLDVESARGELLEVSRAARAADPDVVIKVIVESAALSSLLKDRFEDAIQVACAAIRESGCDFIKTSTGFHAAGGASVAAVRLMKKHAGDPAAGGLQVKASGGIRDWDTARMMLEAGADRLGLSSGVAIIQGLKSDASY